MNLPCRCAGDDGAIRSARRPSSPPRCDSSRVTSGPPVRSVLAVIAGRIDVDQAHLVATAFLSAPRAPRQRDRSRCVRGTSACRRIDGSTVSPPPRLGGPSESCTRGRHEPYPTAAELSESVRRHGVLEICPAIHDRDRRHPLLDTSVGGAYDRLRVVHDIVSHGWWRYGFDRHGEFSAWLTEDRMYTGLARWALAHGTSRRAQCAVDDGNVADHKAILLEPRLLDAVRRRADSGLAA